MKPEGYARTKLRCVECGADALVDREGTLHCQRCGTSFAIVDGVSILLRRDNEMFSPEGAADTARSGFNPSVRWIAKLLPEPTYQDPAPHQIVDLGISALEGLRRLCLVIGGGENPKIWSIATAAFDEVVISDVVRQPETDLVCDGHDIPFLDNAIDMVVATAVLEHVLDPVRVVEEIGRVLRPGGVVVATTAFIEQVHMGAYDFERFTDLGHRWLFRNFKEVQRGSMGGPASALLWSIEYFCRSLCPSYKTALFASGLVRATLFWVKYFDILMRRGPGALDAAAEYYFIGSNCKAPVIGPAELLRQYRGIKRPRAQAR